MIYNVCVFLLLLLLLFFCVYCCNIMSVWSGQDVSFFVLCVSWCFTVCAVTMGCQHCWANGFFGSLSYLTNKYAYLTLLSGISCGPCNNWHYLVVVVVIVVVVVVDDDDDDDDDSLTRANYLDVAGRCQVLWFHVDSSTTSSTVDDIDVTFQRSHLLLHQAPWHPYLHSAPKT